MTEQNGAVTTRRAYELLNDFIRHEIQEGRLQKGDILPPERRMAELLGISRNSVREALQTLQILGIINRRQGSGNYLSYDFGHSFKEVISMMYVAEQIDYRQMLELRQSLEMEAMILACEKQDKELIGQLQSALKRIGRDDSKESAAVDLSFHELIIKASGNMLLINIWEVLQELIDKLVFEARRYILQTPENEKKLNDVHHKMLEGIASGDAKIGLTALYEHQMLIKTNMPPVD